MSRVIKCARCRQPIQGLDEPGKTAIGTCPVCGECDTRENILVEVDEYIRQEHEERINRFFRRFARGSKKFELVEAPHPKRVFRFVVDL
jgi:hypothetical protein